jgi:hypothetical protein
MADSLASSVQAMDLDAPDVDTLIERCKTLHEEVEQYVAAVDTSQKQAKIPYQVEYRTLRSDFKNELAFLQKLKSANHPPEKARHFAVSSNLLYYEALWAAAKRSSGLLAFRKYFYWNRQQGQTKNGVSFSKGSSAKGKTSALVDIVAADGMEWIRVSTTSEKRLLFDLAKLGWQNDSDSEMEDAAPTNWEDEDDDDQVEIVKSARELARAARANPMRGHAPKVRYVLTRLASGKLKEVDTILDKMRAVGITVECANEIPETPSIEDALPNLLVDRSRTLSSTLNIDCTILLALISDISHGECEILDWYPSEVRAQILEEQKEKLLPTHLYPAIASHPMVTTQEAADQMNVIVDTLATDAEKRRANLLLAQRDCQDVAPADLLEEWRTLSNHPAPPNFQLPVRVFPAAVSTRIDALPAVAKKMQDELGPLNTAIFFYGWAEGLTTLSSNRARAKQIERFINEVGLKDGEAGPHVWLCGESRSLIAKCGRRK